MINVDNTLLCDVAKCDALALVRHGFGLTSREPKIAAEVGNIFHSALEAYFLGREQSTIEEIFNNEYARVFPTGQQAQEARFAYENLLIILKRYIEINPLSRLPFEVVEAEQIVGATLESDIMFWAKRDLLVRDKMSGIYAPLDHKTTGKINAFWLAKYKYSSQMTGYVWITQELFNQPLRDCYINAIELALVPSSNKRCKLHGVNYNECGKEHIAFNLLIYSRTMEQIIAWKRDAIILSRQFEKLRKTFNSLEAIPYARRNGVFSNSCDFCEFKCWCVRNFSINMKDAFVIESKWQPWENNKSSS